jgi:hypothetical protein
VQWGQTGAVVVDRGQSGVHCQHVSAESGIILASRFVFNTHSRHQAPAPTASDHLLINDAGVIGSDRCEWLAIVASGTVAHRQHRTMLIST